MTMKSPVLPEKALLVTNEVCLTWSLFSTSTCYPSLQKTSRLVPRTGPPRADGDVRRKKSLYSATAAHNRVMVAKQEVSTACVCDGEAGTHTMALAPPCAAHLGPFQQAELISVGAGGAEAARSTKAELQTTTCAPALNPRTAHTPFHRRSKAISGTGKLPPGSACLSVGLVRSPGAEVSMR